MENFCRGLGFGMVAGIMIGGIVVAKNRKLAGKIRNSLADAEEKMESVKDNIAEKLQEGDCCLFDDCNKQKEKKNS